MLPTDTQKNTAFAYAKQHGVTSPEDYALALGRRLLEATPGRDAARRCGSRSTPGTGSGRRRGHDHAFVRRGGEVRTVVVDVGRDGPSVRLRAPGPGAC